MDASEIDNVLRSPELARISRARRFRDLACSLDQNGLLWVTDFRHPRVNGLMELFSRAGDWDSWTIAIGLLLMQERRDVGVSVLSRVLGALSLCWTLKRVARRRRPSVSVEGFSALLSDPDPYSFPSSHSACSWAASIACARKLGGVAWLLPLYAGLISYSRVHVGAHYPLDVLIGTGIGVAVGSA